MSKEIFGKIIAQFIALGLIEIVHPNPNNDYEMDQNNRYRLTNSGEKYFVDLLAEKV